MQARIAITCSLLALAGCRIKHAPRVVVVPSGSAVSAAARPPGCNLQVLRTAASDRPYDELGSIYYRANLINDPAEANAFIRERACALGADAILVTQEFIPLSRQGPASMSAIAVLFRPPASSVTGSGAAAP